MKKQAIILSAFNSLNNLTEIIFSLDEVLDGRYFIGNTTIKIIENKVVATKARTKKEFK